MSHSIKNKEHLGDGPFKAVSKVLPGMPTSDGAGVKLTRALGQGGLKHLDPFLMLDEIRSDVADDYIAGFPPHPHKGFETLTYMVQGSMEHNDSTGGSGLITSGGVQYMTAGKGIIHSETPKQDSGLMFGFQLWINLAAKDKLQAPKYVDIAPSQVETIDNENVNVKVIAGQLDGQLLGTLSSEAKAVTASDERSNDLKSSTSPLTSDKGPVVRDDINMQMYDVNLHTDKRATSSSTSESALNPASESTSHDKSYLSLSFDKQSQGFIYVYQGELELNGIVLKEKYIAALKPSQTQDEGAGVDTVNDEKESIMLANANTESDVGFLVLMGNPINEPIVQYGPFVMNTMQEIDVALKDYQSGNFV